MSPLGRAKLEYQRLVMIIPPVPDDKGKLRAGGALNGYLLPLLHDLQRMGPPCPVGSSQHLEKCKASLDTSEIGE